MDNAAARHHARRVKHACHARRTLPQMPRPLSEYSLRDHLRLRPVLHALKSARYRRIDRHYYPHPAAAGDEGAVQAAIAGKRLLTTIAFNDVEATTWQARLVRHYVSADAQLIADNSPDSERADAIAEVARREGCLYLRLPPNPWTRRNPSRSHGLAMNWVWRRIIRPAAPLAFGFLDADLFPTAPDDPFAPLEAHAFYGDQRPGDDRWFLWAGYCFYRHAAVAGEPLDFGLDWFAGLDTGGANWDVLYRHIDPTSLPRRPIEPVAALPGVALREAYFEWRGSWLHEVGLAGDLSLRDSKRAAVRAILQPHLDAAGAKGSGGG